MVYLGRHDADAAVDVPAHVLSFRKGHVHRPHPASTGSCKHGKQRQMVERRFHHHHHCRFLLPVYDPTGSWPAASSGKDLPHDDRQRLLKLVWFFDHRHADHQSHRQHFAQAQRFGQERDGKGLCELRCAAALQLAAFLQGRHTGHHPDRHGLSGQLDLLAGL